MSTTPRISKKSYNYVDDEDIENVRKIELNWIEIKLERKKENTEKKNFKYK